MEDLIACIYPFDEGQDGHANRAILLCENLSRYVTARVEVPELPGRYSRESTAPLDGSDDTDAQDFIHGNGLQLTFTHGPKAGPGFLLGTDPSSCDIVLPRRPNISRRHCYLTFDAHRRLILRDQSTNGTVVQYHGEGRERRRHFTWIIGDPNSPERAKEVVIQVDQHLKFLIVVNRPSFPQIYLDNVDRFLRGTAANADLPLGALGIQSDAPTAGPSGLQTPSQDPILLTKKELGRGAFSIVELVWDVSTGIEYASKTFHDPQRFDWRKEARIMRQISHEHVVRLHFVMETPQPRLILEYLPLGSLHDQHGKQRVSEEEVVETLQQALSALTYLHEHVPPIVHRDIKPENILVQSRDPLVIKLGDFGLSRASDELKTMCGTGMYLAPEIAKYAASKSTSRLKYTCAVDIWSLGVVIFQYFHRLPATSKPVGLRWCEKIVRELNDWESDALINLLLNMVVINPQGRMSARKCWEVSLELDRQSRCSTPKPMHSQRTVASPKIWAGHSNPSEKAARATWHAVSIANSSKRQRSPDDDLTKHIRRPSLSIHVDRSPNARVAPGMDRSPNARVTPGNEELSYMSVLELIAGSRNKDEKDDAKTNPRTTALMHTLCQHLRRLEIAHLSAHKDDLTELTTFMATTPFRRFAIAYFTSSEMADSSVISLAECLNRILELMSPERKAVTFSNGQDVVQRADGQVNTMTCRSSRAHSQRCGTRSVAPAPSPRTLVPAGSTRTWSTASDRSCPLIFPSGLLDVAEISDCMPRVES